ncbi:uncharacterized protein LOC133290543 [Gastrolobium bilobum]|uniref:uncharacterized protein LOC133290543 n=1 Tax=Gastrolobium bilobum TaxID=150636 RepID=UPI002AB23624|nr:uncharacterized protein LOC133290543 [Gastrolobium bilobum]
MIQLIEKQPEENERDVEASVEEKNKEKANDTIEVDKRNPEKVERKLFKWEKKKSLERQDKPLDLSPYARIPYPQRLKKEILKQQYSKFLDIFRRKHKLQECETMNPTEECNAIIQKKLPTKVKDPRSFSIPCTIGKVEVDNVLCDLGASINVMPFSMMKKLGITEVKPTRTIVQLVDCSTKQAYGIIEDILVKVDKVFLATSGALIDVLKGELILRVDEEQAIFKFFDKEVPSPIAQPEDQVYYISEKKGGGENKENSPQESKPKVKIEKPKSKGKHIKAKFRVPEDTLSHLYEQEHYGGTQLFNERAWSSLNQCFEPP